jgi:hypothetical protein
MRKCWEHIENKRKKPKITPPLAHPQNEKNRAQHECTLSLLVGRKKFLFPKLFLTIFNVG